MKGLNERTLIDVLNRHGYYIMENMLLLERNGLCIFGKFDDLTEFCAFDIENYVLTDVVKYHLQNEQMLIETYDLPPTFRQDIAEDYVYKNTKPVDINEWIAEHGEYWKEHYASANQMLVFIQDAMRNQGGIK